MALKIRNLNSKMVLHYMITSLRLSHFVNDLCIRLTISINELRYIATKFMHLEEVEYHNKIRVDYVIREKKALNET